MLATIISLAFAVSVFVTAVSLDSSEHSADKVPHLTAAQRYALYEKCQEKLDPDAFASFAYGLVTNELNAAVEPFIVDYQNGQNCDTFLALENKEIKQP